MVESSVTSGPGQPAHDEPQQVPIGSERRHACRRTLVRKASRRTLIRKPERYTSALCRCCDPRASGFDTRGMASLIARDRRGVDRLLQQLRRCVSARRQVSYRQRRACPAPLATVGGDGAFIASVRRSDIGGQLRARRDRAMGLSRFQPRRPFPCRPVAARNRSPNAGKSQAASVVMVATRLGWRPLSRSSGRSIRCRPKASPTSFNAQKR